MSDPVASRPIDATMGATAYTGTAPTKKHFVDSHNDIGLSGLAQRFF